MMTKSFFTKSIIPLAAVLMAGTAIAQPAMTGTPGNTAPGATSNAPMRGVSPTTGVTPNTGVVGRNTGAAAAAGDRNQAVATTDTNAPEPARGANSFSMGEARRRIERSGFSKVMGLKKDVGGVWRGTAEKSGAPTPVWLDYKGNIGMTSAMPSSTTMRPGTATSTTPMAPSSSMSGGTMGTTTGTVPSTTPNTAAGTTAVNPPGTVVTRGVDRTLGTNATGTNPTGSSAISR